jgi:hypothetical protein
VNCEECKEQVLELIERERIDPRGVRETLAKCPECKAEFDAIKTQLAVASQLPLEAPPEHLDVLILQAAEARSAGVAEARAETQPRAWFSRQPLAMAAVALLVVGIGVSTVSIVRGPDPEPLAEAPVLEDLAADEVPLEEVGEAVGSAVPERLELAPASTDELAAREAQTEPPAARRARAGGARSAKKTEPRRVDRDDAPAPAAPKETRQRVALAEADLAAAPAADHYAESELPSLKSGEAKGQEGQEGATAEREQQCKRTISSFEKGQKKDKADFRPTPVQSLDAGLCYQLLGKHADAERWLKRAAEHPSTKARAVEALHRLE